MNSTEELIKDIQKGRIVILMDDEKRENEGDLVVAASFVTPKILNFMLHKARGLTCLSITQKQADQLQLPLMVSKNRNKQQTAFTVTVDAAKGIQSGSSVFDRASTIEIVIDPKSTSEDILTPGHIFPLIAKDGGVLERPGHTEGSIDLVKLAGLYPAAVICEILKSNGEMARLPDLRAFAAAYNLKIGCIGDLISYRKSQGSIY